MKDKTIETLLKNAKQLLKKGKKKNAAQIIKQILEMDPRNEEAVRIHHEYWGNIIIKKRLAEIESMAWSPDGKYLAIGSEDGTMRIWDSKTWKTIKVLEGHAGSVYSISWSPDGKYLASGSIQRLGRAARRISEGIGYVFGAESNRPYSGEILDRTLNAIEPSRLEAALMDLRDTDALLNQVFMEMPSLPKHLVGIYNKTRASIESLSPFINFSCLRARVRPELYITVLVLENVNCDELRKIGSTAELHLPYVVVRDNHMNVQFIGTDLEMYPYLKFGDFALKVDLERSFLSNNHVLLEISKAPRIFPQNLYLANPNYYVEEKNYDLGLMFRGEENA